MSELDHKEGRVPKNWCFWTVVLEKTLESPLDSKEIKSVNSKGNQPWIFIGRTDAEAEAPILWPPDVKDQLTEKIPWCWERLRAGGEGGNRGWDGYIALLTQLHDNWGNYSITDSIYYMNSSKLQEIVKERVSLAPCISWGHRVKHDLVSEQQLCCVSLKFPAISSHFLFLPI